MQKSLVNKIKQENKFNIVISFMNCYETEYHVN